MLNKPYVVALALTSFAVAAFTYVSRQRARSEVQEQHEEDLARWEGEGGKLAPAEPAVVHAG